MKNRTIFITDQASRCLYSHPDLHSALPVSRHEFVKRRRTNRKSAIAKRFFMFDPMNLLFQTFRFLENLQTTNKMWLSNRAYFSRIKISSEIKRIYAGFKHFRYFLSNIFRVSFAKMRNFQIYISPFRSLS